MTIRDWPAAERPREKLLERGAAALSDAELLALFLGAGRAGETAIDAARRLLLRDGGLTPLLDALVAAPARRGIGAAAAARLLGALELARRRFASELDRPQALADPRACARYLQACLGGHMHEVFACLFLDNRHRPIAFEELFRGSIAGTSVHPREVVRRCLAHNAAAVVFAHNHPSGVAEPSQADRDITTRLVEALALVDVRVLDHFIVGSGAPTSFAERGLL